MGNVIAGTGSYLPQTVLTNADLARMPTDFDPVRARGSLDEWCRAHTGAVERRRAGPGENTSDMATRAAQRALDDAGLRAGDIDLLILSTISGDYPVPQSAGIVQANLGMAGRFIQLDAACSGFVDGLMIANSLMDSIGYTNALVIGSDTLSLYIDPGDFMTMSTFGDGAGAVVLRRHTGAQHYGLRSFSGGSNGEIGSLVTVPAGGTRQPITPSALEQRLQYVRVKYPGIYPYAVDKMMQACLEVAQRAGITLDDVDWIVPHQAGCNIISEVAQRLELEPQKFVVIFDRVGNTSSASIPIALDDANRAGKFAGGDWLVLPAVGMGMAWGGVSLVWYDYRTARSANGGSHHGGGI